jgi:hypothetical protein
LRAEFLPARNRSISQPAKCAHHGHVRIEFEPFAALRYEHICLAGWVTSSVVNFLSPQEGDEPTEAESGGCPIVRKYQAERVGGAHSHPLKAYCSPCFSRWCESNALRARGYDFLSVLA